MQFGLRSAPKIFNAIADALEWIFAHSGIYPTHHYLNDLIFLVNQEQSNVDYSHYFVQQVLPLNEVLGQSTVLPFLGIKLDAATMKLYLTSLPAIFSKVMAGQEVMYKEGWLAA